MTLNIVIVGAGVAGLAAAISLRRSGHRVTIYERSSLNNEVGAAINIPPNVSRFLVPWGLDPVSSQFVTSAGIYFISPTTLVEHHQYNNSHLPDVYGAPLYYAHRVDLHEGLRNMATDPEGPGIPVVIHLSSGVRDYNSDNPSIILLNGTEVKADLVIAADGVHSTAVETILGKTEPPQPAQHSNCCYRFLIPRSDLETDPETKFFNQGTQQLGGRLFADPSTRRRLVTYTCRNHEIHNFVAICFNDDIASKKEDWNATVDKKEVLEKFAGYHPGILAVINKATEVKRWPLLYRPPIRKWYKGRMVLVGDAAHPMLPHHGQGGAQAMEDGLAIGLVLHGVKKAADIEARLAVYEKVRLNRAASIQILSNYGVDEAAPEELVDFLEGHPVPRNVGDMLELAYKPDVVQRVVCCMKELDPFFDIPQDFFPRKMKE